MPNEEIILKYNHGEKSMKIPFIIYADMECLVEKIDFCHNNPEKSSTTKINKHTASGYSLFTHCFYDVIKSKHDYYRDKDSMKSFCKDLKENKKIKMISLTIEENQSYRKQKVCHICRKNLVLMTMIKNTIKLEIIVIILENIEAQFIMFVI